MKRRLKPLFLFFLLMGLSVLVSMPAYANDYNLKNIKGKTIYAPLASKKFKQYTLIRWDSSLGELDYGSMKYSKKGLSIEADPEYNFIEITPKKTGTYKFSLKLNDAGKMKKYTFKVKVFKLTKLPFTSIKFGSTKVRLTGLHYSFVESISSKKLLSTGTDTGKFKIKLRKGWSVKSAVMEHNGKTKKVSLKKKITYKNFLDRLTITFKDNKKNELMFELCGVPDNG